MTNAPQYSLGRIPSPPDARNARLADFLDFAALPAPPAKFDNISQIAASRWGVMGNDVHGDCVVAMLGHMLIAWSAAAGQPIIPTTAQVEELYFTLTGGADNGLNILSTLKYLRKNPFLGFQIKGFATVNPKDHVAMKQTMQLFGAVAKGVDLPRTAQAQVGHEWKVITKTGAGQPGSWGGHGIPDMAYNRSTTSCITWGARQYATWGWNDYYCSEAYAVIPMDPPAGFDLAKFEAYLAGVGQRVP